MSFILGDIVTKVQQRVRDTGYSSSEIKNYINDTQNDIFNEYRLPFMETTQDYTLAAGVSDITNGSALPTNYVQAIDLTLTSGGAESVLVYKDIKEIDTTYPDPDDTVTNPSGIPRYWYYYAQTIRVYPAPVAAYTVTLRYYKKPTLLSSDSDVPQVPSQFEEILVVGAAYRVLQVKDNYDQAGILENKYGELLDKMVVKFSQAQVGQATQMRINKYAIGKRYY